MNTIRNTKKWDESDIRTLLGGNQEEAGRVTNNNSAFVKSSWSADDIGVLLGKDKNAANGIVNARTGRTSEATKPQYQPTFNPMLTPSNAWNRNGVQQQNTAPAIGYAPTAKKYAPEAQDALDRVQSKTKAPTQQTKKDAEKKPLASLPMLDRSRALELERELGNEMLDDDQRKAYQQEYDELLAKGREAMPTTSAEDLQTAMDNAWYLLVGGKEMTDKDKDSAQQTVNMLRELVKGVDESTTQGAAVASQARSYADALQQQIGSLNGIGYRSWNFLTSLGNSMAGSTRTAAATANRAWLEDSDLAPIRDRMNEIETQMATMRENGVWDTEQMRALEQEKNDLAAQYEQKRTENAEKYAFTGQEDYFQQQQRGAEQMGNAMLGLSNGQQKAMQVAYSMANNAPEMIASGAAAALTGGQSAVTQVIGALGLAVMGVQSGGSRVNELVQQGITDPSKLLERGVAAGGIEAATEILPVGEWVDLVSNPQTKSLMKSILRQAGSEGGEELVGYIANYVVDVAAKDPNAEFSLAELVESFAMGAASGAGFGVIGAGVNRAITQPMYYKSQFGGDIEGMVADALAANPNDPTALRIQQKLDNGAKVSGRDIQRFVEAQQSTADARQAAIEQEMQQRQQEEQTEPTADMEQLVREGEDAVSGRRLRMPTERNAGVVVNTQEEAEAYDLSQYLEPIVPDTITNSFVDSVMKDADQMAKLGIDPSGKTKSQLRSEVRSALEDAKAAQGTGAFIGENAGEATADELAQLVRDGEAAMAGQQATEAETEPYYNGDEEHDNAAFLAALEPVEQGESAQETTAPSRSEAAPAATETTAADTASDAESAAQSETQTATEEQKQTAKQRGIPVQAVLDAGKYGAQSWAYIKTIQPGQDASKFAAAFDVAFELGKAGGNAAALNDLQSASYLTPTQRQIAFETGAASTRDTVINKSRAGKTTESAKRNAGTVKLANGLKYQDLNKQQRTAVKAIRNIADGIADARGLNVVLKMSSYDDRGIFRAEEGSYNADTNTIVIDLNSGLNTINDIGDVSKYTALRVFSHEFTHYLENTAAEEYADFKKTVFDIMDENLAKQAADGEEALTHEDLVKRKQEQYSATLGREFSAQEAESEVLAEAMTDMMQESELMQQLAGVKPSFLEKIANALKKFVRELKEYFDRLAPNSKAEALALKENGKYLDEVVNAFEQLVTAAMERAAVPASDIKEGAKAISPDAIITDDVTVTTQDGKVYSIRSMNSDIADGKMFKDLQQYCGMSETEVNELRQNLTALVEYMTQFRSIVDMNETHGAEGRSFYPFKQNSDPLYKISMDFSTLCSKRLLTQYVIENLQKQQQRALSAEEQMAIRAMLNEYRQQEKALQVACGMCYVEAARLKAPKQINAWLDNPKPYMINYLAQKNKAFKAEVEQAKADFKVSRGYDADATKKDMKPADRKALEAMTKKKRQEYVPTAEEQVMIDKLMALPRETFLTSGNLAALAESNPTIYDAYSTHVRAATHSKPLETDEPYYYGDTRLNNGTNVPVTDSFIESVNAENGMRFSSWSDWRVQHLLDYITAVIDMSVRGASMHGYTKFTEEVDVLGKTGMMFNMSGVLQGDNGMNANGELDFSPTESVDIEKAKLMREKYPETAGIQCIGVSKESTIALLESDFIDYVIPYHVSGLNAGLRRMAGIGGWMDYTKTQHALDDTSIKKEDAIDPEHWHEEPVFSEFFVGYDTGMSGIEAMRQSAENYKRMCRERGLIPKFNEYAGEDNYWKLLIDRKMINQQTGELIQQKPVRPVFDFSKDGAIYSIIDRYVQNYDAGLETRALNYIEKNWESIPGKIKELSKAKKSGSGKRKAVKKAASTLANEMLAAQPVVNEAVSADNGDAVQYSVRVTDNETYTLPNGKTVNALDYLNSLEQEGVDFIYTYKSMSYWGEDENGNAILRSPMAEQNPDGSLSGAYLLSKDGKPIWYKAEENPVGLLIKGSKEDGAEHEDKYYPMESSPVKLADDWSNAYYKLVRRNPISGELETVYARYNPYEHSSNKVLNDQFKGAYKRPNLVTVKMKVPLSEQAAGYRAEYSKDPTGWVSWKSGDVASKIAAANPGFSRDVFLSRYAAPVEIMSDEWVAERYKEYLDGTGIDVPWNVVSPGLRAALENAGVGISYTDAIAGSARQAFLKFNKNEVEKAKAWAETAPARYESALERATADYGKAQEEFQRLSKAYRKDKSLLAKKDAAKAARDSAKNRMNSAQKELAAVVEYRNRFSDATGTQYSLRDQPESGKAIRKMLAGTFFSGGGTVDFALSGIIDSQFAVEYDGKISAVYRANNETTFMGQDVQDFDPEQWRGKIDYFHASPVCKTYSRAISNDGRKTRIDTGIDMVTAQATVKALNVIQPKYFTLENVPAYEKSKEMKLIVKTLHDLGYGVSVGKYNAADYGAATSRERVILRAVKDGTVPAAPRKVGKRTTWFDAVEDLIPSLPEAKTVNPRMVESLRDISGIDVSNIDKPLLVFGESYKNKEFGHAFADSVAPTIIANSGASRIFMPDGRVLEATPRVLARISGLPDTYRLPDSAVTARTIIGNGVPVQMTQAIIGSFLKDASGLDVQHSIRVTDSDGRTLTEAQQEYFRDSKVRDKDGNLLRMYHGTRADFTVFERKFIGSTGAFEGSGFNFTPSEDRAKGYGGNVMTGYVDVRKPMSADSVTMTARQLANIIKAADPTGDDIIANYARETRDYGRQTFVNRESLVAARSIMQAASSDLDIYSDISASSGGSVSLIDVFKGLGYDGAIHYDENGNIKTVIAFDSEQFKNFDNESPTADPDIRYSIRESTLSNRDILKAAADDARQAQTDGKEKGKPVFSEKEAATLHIFRARLNKLEQAQEQRMDILGQKRELLNGRKPTELSGAEKSTLRGIQNNLDTVNEKIRKLNDAVLEVEDKAVLKDVLKRSREIVERDAIARAKEELTAYKETARQKKNDAVKAQREKDAARLDAYRDRAAEKLQAQKDHDREVMQNDRERRQATELRHKIGRKANEFRQILLHPTDGRYAPTGLVDACIDVAMMLDTTGSKEDTKAKRKFRNMMEALGALKDQYAKLAKSSDYDYASEYDPEFERMVGELRESIGDKPVRELTLAQLEDVNSILNDLNAMLKDAKYQLGKADRVSNYDLGESIITEAREVKPRTTGEKAADAMFRNTGSTLRNIARITGYNENAALSMLFYDLNEGVKKKNSFIMQAEKKFEPFVGKRFAQSANDVRVYNTGKRVMEMTEMEAIQAVLTWEREAAGVTNHMNRDGITIPDHELMRKGKYRDAIIQGARYAWVTQDEIDAIKGTFDEWALAYMDTAREFFNADAKKAINDTTMVTKHRPVALSEKYIPIEVDQNYIASELEGVKFDATIDGMGMLKSVVSGASNPIIMRGLHTIIANHAERVGQVYGLAIPVRNINKAMGMREVGGDMTPKKALGMAWGSADVELIEQAITDLQTARPKANDTLSKALRAMQSKFVQATLLSNVSVTIKQAASYPTAGLYLSQKALNAHIGTVARIFGNNNSKYAKALFAEIDAHTPEHYIRRKGMSMQEINTIAQNSSKVVRWMDDTLPDAANPLKWIQGMDVATTAALWEATKTQVELDGVKPTDAAYWDKVTELYEKVIEDTQPMYDVLHRPEVQKSTNELMRNILMFRTQPLQNSGILYDAAGELAHARKSGDAAAVKKASKKMASAVGSQLQSLAVFATMTMLAYAVRNRMKRYKDDEDELTVGSVSKRIVGDMAENAAQLVMPIGGDWIAGQIEKTVTGSQYGGEIAVPVVDAMNTYISDYQQVWKDIADGKTDKIQGDLQTVGMDVAAIFGIPASNVYNIFRGIIGNVGDLTGHPVSWATDQSAPTMNVINLQLERGKMAKAKANIDAYIADKVAGGKSEEDTVKSVKSALNTHWKPLYQAAAAKGDTAEMARIRKLLHETGVYESVDEIVTVCAKWQYADWDIDGNGLSQQEVYFALEHGNYSDTERERIWAQFGWKTDYKDYKPKN